MDVKLLKLYRSKFYLLLTDKHAFLIKEDNEEYITFAKTILSETGANWKVTKKMEQYWREFYAEKGLVNLANDEVRKKAKKKPNLEYM